MTRRDDRVVQVGLDAPHRALFPADPEVLAVLGGLRDGTLAPDHDDATGTIAALAAADLLEVVPAPRARAPLAPVRLTSYDVDLAPLRARLGLLGIGTATGDELPGIEVVASRGPLPRERIDDLVAGGAPHLVLCGTGRPGSLRLGPLVEPGTTACLRCVDAHEAEADPRRPLIVAQLAELTAAPVAATTLDLALAWAARDVASYLSGGRPSTWSATVEVDVDVPTVREWRRHPWCGCAWDLLPY